MNYFTTGVVIATLIHCISGGNILSKRSFEGGSMEFGMDLDKQATIDKRAFEQKGVVDCAAINIHCDPPKMSERSCKYGYNPKIKVSDENDCSCVSEYECCGASCPILTDKDWKICENPRKYGIGKFFPVETEDCCDCKTVICLPCMKYILAKPGDGVGLVQYLFVAEKLDWSAAEKHCRELGVGGSLAVVSSDASMREVRKVQNGQRVWIGLVRSKDGTTWETPNHSVNHYHAWDAGQPGTHENCVVQYKSGKWHDYPCNHKKSFVCQIAMSSNPFTASFGQMILRNEKYSGIDTVAALLDSTTPNVQTGSGYSNLMKPFKGAWVDRDFIQNWKQNMHVGTKVRFTFWRKDSDTMKPVVDYIFNGEGTDSGNWFTKDKLIKILKGPKIDKNINFNYWSLAGHVTGAVTRHFFINKNYGGCGRDFGMIAVTDKVDVCHAYWMGGKGWQGFPRFLYASKPDGCLWKDTSCAKEADTITISILTKPDEVNDQTHRHFYCKNKCDEPQKIADPETKCPDYVCRPKPAPAYPEPKCNSKCHEVETKKDDCGHDYNVCKCKNHVDCTPDEPEKKDCLYVKKVLIDEYSCNPTDKTKCMQCHKWEYDLIPGKDNKKVCKKCEAKVRVFNGCHSLDTKCECRVPTNCHPDKPTPPPCTNAVRVEEPHSTMCDHRQSIYECIPCYHWDFVPVMAQMKCLLDHYKG